MSKTCKNCIWNADGECICNPWDLWYCCPDEADPERLQELERMLQEIGMEIRKE